MTKLMHVFSHAWIVKNLLNRLLLNTDYNLLLTDLIDKPVSTEGHVE